MCCSSSMVYNFRNLYAVAKIMLLFEISIKFATGRFDRCFEYESISKKFRSLGGISYV